MFTLHITEPVIKQLERKEMEPANAAIANINQEAFMF
jgi:hypothetical protein